MRKCLHQAQYILAYLQLREINMLQTLTASQEFLQVLQYLLHIYNPIMLWCNSLAIFFQTTSMICDIFSSILLFSLCLCWSTFEIEIFFV